MGHKSPTLSISNISGSSSLHKRQTAKGEYLILTLDSAFSPTEYFLLKNFYIRLRAFREK